MCSCVNSVHHYIRCRVDLVHASMGPTCANPRRSAVRRFLARPRPARWSAFFILIAVALATRSLVFRGGAGQPVASRALTRPLLARAVPGKSLNTHAPAQTLVTYVFAPSDAAAAENLRFFVDHALYGGALGDDLVAAAEASALSRRWSANSGTVSGARRARAALVTLEASTPGAHHRPSFVYDDGADYVFLIQGGTDALGKLPPAAAATVAAAIARASTHPRATVLHRPNTCYDWGAWGWALRPRSLGGGGLVRPHHRYFLLVNSSVRGPFVPPAAHAAATAAARAVMGDETAPRVVVPWHALLTTLLGGPGDVRLAGPAISCEGAPQAGPGTQGWLFSPHVQSWAVATDRIGLAIWEEAGGNAGPLACHADRAAAIAHGEVGGSAAILAAGKGLACLLPRYAGVEWRGAARAGQAAAVDAPPLANGTIPPGPGPAVAWCNQRVAPTGDGGFDGTTLPPTELLFVKHKSDGGRSAEPNSAAWAGAKAAAWAEQTGQAQGRTSADVATNAGPGKYAAWQGSLPEGVDGRGVRLSWVGL